MKKVILSSIALGLYIAFFLLEAQAHTPLFDCFDNGDGSITCEGGFTDGASAAGIPVRVLSVQGKVLAQSPVDKNNSVDFERPEGGFSVIFDAGKGHSITIFGDDIY